METLVSVLVVSLSSVMLVSALIVAMNLNGAAKQADIQFRQELEIAERGGGTQVGEVQVQFPSGIVRYGVRFAGDIANGALTSYEVELGS